MFGLKGMAIAAGVALVIGSVSGWKTRDAFCDAAAAKAEVARLTNILNAAKIASEEDAKAVRADADKAEELEKAIRDAQVSVDRNDGQCLDSYKSDRLRSLWK